MRQSDRILKAVYREGFNHLTYKQKKNEQGEFSLSNSQFVSKIKTIYQTLYPYNHSGDELDSIIEYTNQNIKNRYNSSNIIHLIPLLANKLFYIKNDKLVVKYEHLLEWNGFQNKLDSNVFIGAFIASNLWEKSYLEKKEPNSLIEDLDIVIRHDNTRLYKLFELGLYEGHMHLKGSGQTAEISWNNILKLCFFKSNHILNFIKDMNNFKKQKSQGHSEEDILLMILKLKLIRILFEEKNSEDIFKDKENHRIFNMVYLEDLKDFKSELLFNKDKIKKWHRRIVKKISEDETKKACVSERKFFYREFTNVLNKNYENTTLFLDLLNYYIWGSTVVKFEFYQDNLFMGFQNFKQYESIKDYFIENNESIYESVFQKYYEEGYVKKIEFRISPKTGEEIKTIVTQLDEINERVFRKYKSYNDELSKIEYGLIIHYIKNDELSKVFEGSTASKFHKYIVQLEKQSQVIEDALLRDCKREINRMGRKIIGMDAANTEVSSPPEIFSFYFRKFRTMTDNMGGLNFTFHVGEEFKTLSTGLRHIDETIEFMDYRRGDRIGHGLAIGIDVDEHYKLKRYVEYTDLQDYIDNLCWLYHKCSLDDNIKNSHVLKDIFNREIAKLLPREVNCSIQDYYQSMLLRGDNRKYYYDIATLSDDSNINLLKSSTDFNMRHDEYRLAFDNAKARKIHHDYLFNSELNFNGKKIIKYTVDSNWLSFIKSAQYYIKRKISDKGIIVEANPSSNRKISSVTHYSKLPFLKMNSKFLKNETNGINIPITINTDDSAIFQTNLSNEYSLIASALERDGYGTEEIYQYIEYLLVSAKQNLFI